MLNKRKAPFVSGLSVIAIMFFVLGGCTTLKMGNEIADPKILLNGMEDKLRVGDEKSLGFDKDDNNLILAAVELEILSAEADDAQKSIQRSQKILPDWMKGSSFVQKAVGNSLIYTGNRTLRRKDGEIQTFEIQNLTINDLKSFAEMSLKMNGLFVKPKKYSDTLLKKKAEKREDKSIYDYRLLYYLAAYFENKYVDRSGTLYPKPKFSAAIGNDTIIPLISITLDAFYDSLYSIPVFYEDKKCKKPLAGKEPTVAKFEDDINHNSDIRRYIIDKKIKDANNQEIDNPEWNDPDIDKKITKREAQALKLISGIGGEQSKALSGLMIRALGDVEFGAVVIGAHVSVGDNDTLSRLIEAMVDQVSRRSVEASFYELFKKKEGDNQNFVELLKLVGDIYGSLEQ